MIHVESKMDFRAHSGQVLRWLGATAAAALTTFVLVWLGANSTTAGMVFLVLVVWWATQGGAALSIYIASLCAAVFDYFFLPPIHTFWLVGAQAWVAMFSFVASCVVVSRLAERARRQTAQAEQRQADVGRLYALSQEMMLFEDAERLLHDLPTLIRRIFDLKSVVVYICDQDRFYSSASAVPVTV
jgi:two-component system, OmpR family, sensor histidine kinase KdpD